MANETPSSDSAVAPSDDAAAPTLRKRLARWLADRAESRSRHSGQHSGSGVSNLDITLAAGHVLGDEAVTPGSVISLRVPADAGGWPVVVRSSKDAAEVLYPESPEDWLPLDSFPGGPEGRQIDLVVEGPAGNWTYAIGLVPGTDSAPNDWATVERALAEGEHRVGGVSIDVG